MQRTQTHPSCPFSDKAPLSQRITQRYQHTIFTRDPCFCQLSHTVGRVHTATSPCSADPNLCLTLAHPLNKTPLSHTRTHLRHHTAHFQEHTLRSQEARDCIDQDPSEFNSHIPRFNSATVGPYSRHYNLSIAQMSPPLN